MISTDSPDLDFVLNNLPAAVTGMCVMASHYDFSVEKFRAENPEWPGSDDPRFWGLLQNLFTLAKQHKSAVHGKTGRIGRSNTSRQDQQAAASAPSGVAA